MSPARATVRVAVLLALLILAAPATQAGTERAPEISDARDVAEASADILAVWLEPADGGARLTVKVARIPQEVPNHLFVTLFTLDGERHAAKIGFDASGRAYADATSYGGQTAHAGMRDVRFRAGAPAYLSATLPWGIYDGFQPGARLEGLEAYSSYHRAGMTQWAAAYDTASAGANARPALPAATGTAVAAAADDDATTMAWVAPLILAAAAVGGAAAGAALRRRAKEAARR